MADKHIAYQVVVKISHEAAEHRRNFVDGQVLELPFFVHYHNLAISKADYLDVASDELLQLFEREVCAVLRIYVLRAPIRHDEKRLIILFHNAYLMLSNTNLLTLPMPS